MSEEMFCVLKRYIEVNGFDFKLACDVLNYKYGTGFMVGELRDLYSVRFGEPVAC